jgi:hypothetical protein
VRNLTEEQRAAKLREMEEAAALRRASGRIVIGRSRPHPPAGPPRRAMPEEKQGADQPIAYEIYGRDHPDVISGSRKSPTGSTLGADDPFVIQLKVRINAAGITRREICTTFVGFGPNHLFENDNQAYNLEYGLRWRPTITLSCARRWLAILGDQLGTLIQPTGGSGWHDNLLRLRDEVASSTLPEMEELRELAASATPGNGNDLLIMPIIRGFESE